MTKAYEGRGNPWTKEEDDLLLQWAKDDSASEERAALVVSELTKRTPAGIQARLEKWRREGNLASEAALALYVALKKNVRATPKAQPKSIGSKWMTRSAAAAAVNRSVQTLNTWVMRNKVRTRQFQGLTHLRMVDVRQVNRKSKRRNGAEVIQPAPEIRAKVARAIEPREPLNGATKRARLIVECVEAGVMSKPEAFEKLRAILQGGEDE